MNNRTGIVYMATNSENGLSYIGRTIKDLDDRMYEHKRTTSKRDTPFGVAIREYGFEVFKWTILYDNVPENELTELEKQTIKEFQTYNRKYGYNKTNGGEGSTGRKLTPEHKEKIRQSLLGNPSSRKGSKCTPEHKEKVRQAKLGSKHTHEAKGKMGEASSRYWAKYRAEQVAPDQLFMFE